MTTSIEACVALLLGLITWELSRASYKAPGTNSDPSVIVELSAGVVAVAVNGPKMGQAARNVLWRKEGGKWQPPCRT